MLLTPHSGYMICPHSTTGLPLTTSPGRSLQPHGYVNRHHPHRQGTTHLPQSHRLCTLSSPPLRPCNPWKRTAVPRSPPCARGPRQASTLWHSTCRCGRTRQSPAGKGGGGAEGCGMCGRRMGERRARGVEWCVTSGNRRSVWREAPLRLPSQRSCAWGRASPSSSRRMSWAMAPRWRGKQTPKEAPRELCASPALQHATCMPFPGSAPCSTKQLAFQPPHSSPSAGGRPLPAGPGCR